MLTNFSGIRSQENRPRSRSRRLSLQVLESRRLLAGNSFQTHIIDPGPIPTKVADLNGDGYPDIYSASSWYANDGQGSFTKEIAIDGESDDDATAHDVDGDGDLDLVLQESLYPRSLRWLENVAGGTFAKQSMIADMGPNQFIRSYELDDLDADGDADFAVVEGTPASGYNSELREYTEPETYAFTWYENTNTGYQRHELHEMTSRRNLGEADYYSLVRFDFFYDWADVDGDGNLDFVTETDESLTLNLNDGSANFTAHSLAKPTTLSVQALVDLDQDGDLDVVGTAATDGFSIDEFDWNRTNELLWYRNDNNTSLVKQSNFQRFHCGSFSSVGGHCRVDVQNVDLDQDGDNDLAVQFYSIQYRKDKLYVLLNDGSGGMTQSDTIDLLSGTKLEWVDVEGDGDLDLVGGSDFCYGDSCENGLRWYENNGGTLHLAYSTELGGEPVLADFDGDSDIDILSVINTQFWNREAAWFENNGTGDFGSPNLIAIASGSELSVGDVDGDGDLDIAANASSTAFWYENQGDGLFVPRMIERRVLRGIPYGKEVERTALKDRDGDGDLDFERSNRQWFENDGQGNFSGPLPFADDEIFEEPLERNILVDFDGDGDLDALRRFQGSRITWRETIEPVIGDANCDGEFDSADLVIVFQAGEYEDGIADNSTFEEGDWNGDGEFDSGDLVNAFQAGLYQLTATADFGLSASRRLAIRDSLFAVALNEQDTERNPWSMTRVYR